MKRSLLILSVADENIIIVHFVEHNLEHRLSEGFNEEEIHPYINWGKSPLEAFLEHSFSRLMKSRSLNRLTT